MLSVDVNQSRTRYPWTGLPWHSLLFPQFSPTIVFAATCSLRGAFSVKGKGILFNVSGQTGQECLLTWANGVKVLSVSASCRLSPGMAEDNIKLVKLRTAC